MKALSLKQPWLYCVTNLDKLVENRTWRPPHSMIGKTFALHASAKSDRFEFAGASRIAGASLELLPMPYGAIVATAKIIGWLDENGNGEVPNPCLGHYVDDKWFFGPYGWILDSVRLLKEPVPAKGALGFWTVPEEVEAQFIYG